MNTQKCMLYLTVILSFAISGLPAMAQALTFAELRPDAPICRTSKAKRPKLPVNFEHDAPVEITADLNGDGWCDYALGVGYPVNSQMNSYYLSQMLLLGGAKKWEYALHGRKPWLPPVGSLDADHNDIWPVFQVDLTDKIGRAHV